MSFNVATVRSRIDAASAANKGKASEDETETDAMDEEDASSEASEDDVEGEDETECEPEASEEEEAPAPAPKKAKKLSAAEGERARIAGIMRAPAAASLPTLAQVLAYDTGFTVEASVALLDAAAVDLPKASKAGKDGNTFVGAMRRVANPNIAPGASGAEAGGDETDKLLASHRELAAKNGIKLRPAAAK